MVSRISVRFMGEEELVTEVRDLVRATLEKKGYYELSSPPKKYEAAGKDNARMYLDVVKRSKGTV